jgi:hypothetical protein
VVLKIYSDIGKAPDVARHEMFREVAIQSSLQHPNIIQLHAAFQVRPPPPPHAAASTRVPPPSASQSFTQALFPNDPSWNTPHGRDPH